jgi:flagellar hook assembly protein FlgD
VNLGVYDVTGRLVKMLVCGTFEPGVRTVTWDRTSDSGSRVAGGTYFCRLAAGGLSAVAKLVLVE